MITLYNEIKDYLLSLGFSIEGENDVTIFRIKRLIPGRTLIVNGQHMEEPDQWGYFDITPLGPGAILNRELPDTPLEGFSIIDNDLWVDSLKDFKFWLQQIVGHSNIQIE